MTDPNLVTTCNFHGQEFLFKMNVSSNNLEILVTDKSSGEEWQCSYDATYIENLTHKTGNFKQFDIFVAMIKSGLLRTSESVSLDLLTYDDLEMLRSRKIVKSSTACTNNRRYLIVTYVVEFDKIRYPLPLEYCGPPDPLILQATIKRLETELAKAKEELQVKSNDSKNSFYLEKRIEQLAEENYRLQEENRNLYKLLGKKPKSQMLSLQKAVDNLEKCVVSERNSHHEIVDKLRTDKMQLVRELEKVKCSERSLKAKLNRALSKQSTRLAYGDFNASRNSSQEEILKTVYQRSGKSQDNKNPRSKIQKKTNSLDEIKGTRSFMSCNLHNLSSSRSSSISSGKSKYADPLSDNLSPINSKQCFARRKSPFNNNNNNKINDNVNTKKQRNRSRSASVESTASERNKSRARKSRSKGPGRKVDIESLKKQLDHLHKLINGSDIN